MPLIRSLLKISSLLLLGFIVSGCSKDAEEAASESLLRYVPADTPYILVTQDRLPDDLYEKVEPKLDRMLVAYQKLMHAVAEGGMADIESSELSEADLEKISAIIAELDTLLSLDGLESAGIDRDSRFAFYGNGLLPVMRISLSDGELLEAAVARIEASAGEKMSVATVGGQSYRYVGDDEWRVVVAIIGDQFVLSFVPESFTDPDLEKVLGLTLPESSIADTNRLSDVSNKYQFEDFMIGLIDVQQIVATFLDEPTGLNAVLLEQSDFDASELDDVCRDEIRAMGGVMPQIVSGYTEISGDSIASRLVVELREDIAAGFATFAGEVPGLGASHDGLFSLGMSFDLLAMREYYAGRLDALEANPFKCDLFADFQEGVAAGRELLNQPVPPIAYSFRGFLAVVHDVVGMDMQNNIPPTSVDMQMLIATDNAEGLLAMGAMFSPEIAALNLEVGGDPVKIESPQLDQLGETAYAAMSDTALALSVGEDMENGLKNLLAAPFTDPPTTFSVDFDAGSYYELISQSVAADPDGDLAEMPELKEAVQELMAVPGELFERFKVDVVFTSNGVEVVSEATLQD